MNREDIIRMAREAGFSSAVGKHIALDDELERFFQAAYAAGAAAEREACAKVCDKLYDKFSDDPDMVRLKARHAFVLDDCAAAIRARGQA